MSPEVDPDTGIPLRGRPYHFEITWNGGAARERRESEELPPDSSYIDAVWYAVTFAKRLGRPVTIVKHLDVRPNEPLPLLTVTAVVPDITKGIP